MSILAATVDPQECPLNGLYSLRGAIGPPFISSRHKRNHNKAHHHHHEAQYKRYVNYHYSTPVFVENYNLNFNTHVSILIGIPFFRYTALSFRNPEEFSNLDWQMRSRIAPLRNRREVRSKRRSNGTIIESSNNIDANNDTARVILPTTDDKQNSTDIDIQRSKRDTPECVINYNSARQLFVGCSQSNVVEVKPHCSDDGDEGM